MTGTLGTLSAALEHEHRLIDSGIEAFAGHDASDTPVTTEQQRTALARAITSLRRHIYLEEEFLFPPLRNAGLVGPVMVMVREHGRMWLVLDLLEQLLVLGSTGDTASACKDLLGQLASHNTKEERILYPQADMLLPPAELAALTSRLTVAAIPEGWVCQGVSTG